MGERLEDLETLKAIQLDLFSGQAACWMELLRPLLPDTKAASVLADWDLRYDVEALVRARSEGPQLSLFSTV